MRRCCVPGCDTRKSSSCSFYTFPSASELKITQVRLKLWIEAVFGEDRPIFKCSSICGKHFVTGKPAKITETSAVNWIPTLHLGQGRVAPKINIVCGLPSIENGVLAPEQVIFKKKNVIRLIKSNEVDPFQGASTPVTVKEEVPDESPENPELVIFKEQPVVIKKEVPDEEEGRAMSEVQTEQRVVQIGKSNEVEEYLTVESVKEEVPVVEKAKKKPDVPKIQDGDKGIQSLPKIQARSNALRCMFCLNKLASKEQVLPDFNKDSTFRTQVEYVLAKTIESSSYPCCTNCRAMFQLFYEFKKSCLIALTKPQELIRSTIQKRPANHPIGPAPKRKPETVAIHVKLDKPSEVESSAKEEDEPEEPPSLDGYMEERLRCKNCGTMHDSGVKLEDHKLKCLPPKEKPRCHLCPAVLRNNWELQVHLNRHNGVNPFPCRKEGCSKTFAGPVIRIMHEKKCQIEANNAVCAICGMTFKCDSYLRNHMVIHDAPKYECAVCRRKFCDVTTFRAHMMRHFERNETPADRKDGEDVQLDFQCDSCEQAFDTPELWNGHKVYCGKNAKFRKFQLLCPLCPESFQKQETLDQHLNRHKGIKSIPCRKEGCDKMFFDTPGRNVHELYRCGRGGVESGKHVCSICQAAHVSPAALRIHMKSHKKATAVLD